VVYIVAIVLSLGVAELRPPKFASTGSRFIGVRGSEFPEVKIVAVDTEVFDNVGDDAAGHVARTPCKRDETVGAEGRVKDFQSHAVGNIEHSTSNLRGRLFLAWLSQALQICKVADAERDGRQSSFAQKRASEDRPGVLAAQTFFEQETRSCCKPDVASLRLAGGADLGMRFGETSRGLRSPDSAGVGLISGARLLTLDLISVCGKACSPAWLLHAMPQPKDVPFPN